VAAAGLDELGQDHPSAVDPLGVGEDQLHLLGNNPRQTGGREGAWRGWARA
jgi:hypothetical protein